MVCIIEMRAKIVHGVLVEGGGEGKEGRVHTETHNQHKKKYYEEKKKKSIKYHQRLIEALHTPILLSQSQNVNDSH